MTAALDAALDAACGRVFDLALGVKPAPRPIAPAEVASVQALVPSLLRVIEPIVQAHGELPTVAALVIVTDAITTSSQMLADAVVLADAADPPLEPPAWEG